MEHITLNKLIKYLQNFATDHALINSFFCGDVDNFPTTGVQYPMLYVNIPSTRIVGNELHRKAYIYFLDKLKAESTNKNEIASDAETVLLDLRNYFERADELGIISDLTVTIDSEIEKVTEEFNTDWVYGQMMTCTFVSEFLGDVCNIPNVNVLAGTIEEYIPSASAYLTCQSLSGCSTIQTIQNNIQQLYTLTGSSSGSSFDCSQLSGCSTIQSIQNDISGLQSVSGSSSFNCNDLNGCANFQSVSSSTFSNQQAISDIITFSGQTIEWQDLAAAVITEHTTDIEYLKQWTAATSTTIQTMQNDIALSTDHWRAGELVSQNAYQVAGATASIAANTVHYFPIKALKNCNISEAAFLYINSGTNFKMAMYSANTSTLEPSTKLAEVGSTAVGSGAIKKLTGLNINLTKGQWYYLAVMVDASTNIWKINSAPIIKITDVSPYPEQVRGYTSSQTYATGFPSDASSLTLNILNADPALVYLKINTIS